MFQARTKVMFQHYYMLSLFIYLLYYYCLFGCYHLKYIYIIIHNFDVAQIASFSEPVVRGARV